MSEAETNATSTSSTQQSSSHIAEPIMPTKEIHLISGPSNAGKTTLAFQMIEEWLAGLPVLGLYRSFPMPCLYVACDRSGASTVRTLARIGIKTKIPILSLVDNPIPESTPSQLLALARKQQPNVRVLFIDAMAVLCPGKVTDYSIVCKFMASLARLCQKESLTIIGMGHTAKVRGDDKVSDPRQRFLGSVAWGGFADCMLHIEPTNPDDPTDPRRQLYVLPKNARSELLDYRFNDEGRLVSLTAESAALILDQWLLKCPVGHVVTTATFVEIGGHAGLHKATVHRWIKEAIASGRIAKSGHGEYKVLGKN